ncbi:hypothetical protein PoB_005364800 [Plakobranchus ocellatus]|uniref:Uncharacterized protein n=1 Tax=Plakobranchus ocellatus TaxID=259542 RepID=A0AAV4C5H6_9GAST|nr:hypothetical protein PoB_005364800 [Plakobranchus ocellatus]
MPRPQSPITEPALLSATAAKSHQFRTLRLAKLTTSAALREMTAGVFIPWLQQKKPICRHLYGALLALGEGNGPVLNNSHHFQTVTISSP